MEEKVNTHKKASAKDKRPSTGLRRARWSPDPEAVGKAVGGVIGAVLDAVLPWK